ncbi:fat-like cadherin-related tumor suppressor homolog, partial [Teleopsis dalmanni]|uniref:fat-like cadherin-related tumor suppressor homolog n=1 Tax=Teleopsis dalmanni TaxID=139649 RepID=UPI0018CCCDF1
MMYYIITGNDQKHFRINSTNGVIYVNDSLDYEQLNSYFLTIQVVDEENPTFSSISLFKIRVLDVNDNAPSFSQKFYCIKVQENITVGKSILKLDANDKDSKQNGVIKYSIENINNFEEFDIDMLHGNIFTKKNLDRESTASFTLNVSACDSGTPELCTYANVYVEIMDVNDNAPLFSSSNYSLVVQESNSMSNFILKFNIFDSDEYPNTYPFIFYIHRGNNNGQFSITPNGSLKIVSKLNRELCDLYNLQIRVFDNGTPSLHSDTWVRIQVAEESQHPPLITPLEITVNSFEDEFIGGYLGQLHVTDQDKHDTLYFNISQTDDVTGMQKLFYINGKNGLLYAVGILDVGVYNVSVTVSDGKFQSNSIVKINVQLINSELIAKSLTIRLKKVSAKDFLLIHQKSFVRSISAVMGCPTKNVVIISLSNGTSNRIRNRAYLKKGISLTTLNVVFGIQNQQNIYKNYTSEYMYTTITNQIEEIEHDTKLLIEELREPYCSKEICSNGICANSIKLHKRNFTVYDLDIVSFVVPRYEETVKCICKQGFNGNNCETIVDVCASNPCTSQKFCVQTKTLKGFECICPKGLTGEYCESDVVMSFKGNSYAHYKINNGFAKLSSTNQFHFSFRVITIQTTATLLYVSGKIDYNILEIFQGTVQYRFDLGTGEAIVSVKTVNISDGNWHTIMLDRNINSATLIVDEKYSSEGQAPGIKVMYNTHNNDIFFGAEVRRSIMIGYDEIRRGFWGCLADLKFSFILLPLHRYESNSIVSLKRFNNIDFTCNITNILTRHEKCGAQPCQNGGQCLKLKKTNFQCKCPPRYSGRACEFDLNPCISMPCLNGGLCQYVHLGNYSCICPSKLSGRHCEYGKFCSPNPCKNGGLCIEDEMSFHCICPGYTGTTCEVDINECDNNPCEKGTICINKLGSYQCICSIFNNGSNCIDLLHINSISKFKTIIIDQTTSLITVIGLIVIVVLILLYTIVSKNQSCKIKNNSSVCKKTISEVNDLKFKHTVNNLMPPVNENVYTQNTLVNDLDIVRSYGIVADKCERDSLEFQINNQSSQRHNIILCNYSASDLIPKNISEKKHFKTFRENKLNY